MNYEMDVSLLSASFIADYLQKEYPELMIKRSRPYTCLLIDCHADYLICIPFRSHINHKNAFMFTQSARSQKMRSGLDYSKTVLIQKGDYISKDKAVVDSDEYVEMIQNVDKIVRQIIKYIDDYVNHIKGTTVMHYKAFNRKYRCTTLKYFHDILGI